jgi:hypothetical protein
MPETEEELQHRARRLEVEIEHWLSPAEAAKKYPILYRMMHNVVKRKYGGSEAGSKRWTTAQIVSIVDGLCHSCREAPRGCQCWNERVKE